MDMETLTTIAEIGIWSVAIGTFIYSLKNSKKWAEESHPKRIDNSINYLQFNYERDPDFFTDDALKGIKKLYDTIEDRL